jgi:hypothetical protein
MSKAFGAPCSPVSEDEPSARDYMRWLAAKVASLPEVFAGVNENFVSVAIEGALWMAGDSVDMDALQTSTAVIAGRMSCWGSETCEELPRASGGAPSVTSQHLMPFNGN